MAEIPELAATLLDDIAGEFPTLLGSNLVGIYLYGSLTQRAFDPRHSDIDVIVVTARALSDAQFRRVEAWLAQRADDNPWTLRLQVSFFQQGRLLESTAEPVACLYQHRVLKRCGSDANCIVWRNVLESGIILCGPQAAEFVPRITRAMFEASLRLELNYLREEIEGADSKWRHRPFYQAYAVLTVCRILYSLTKNKVVAKPVAARWALKSLPEQWHSLIRQALESRELDGIKALPLEEVAAFIEMARNINVRVP